MTKKILILFVLCVASLLFFACQPKSSLDIGLAMPETHVERWQRDGAGLKEFAEAKGYTAEVAYGDADQAKQNQQIEDFVTKGARLLVIGGINDGVAEAVAKAAEEGVIVIAYDRLITNSDDYDYYVTFDNYKVGSFQGRAIVDALSLDNGEAKNVVFFAGSPTDNNAKFFFDGAVDVLRPYVQTDVLSVVGPGPLSSSDPSFTQITTEGWKADIAKARAENLLVNDARDVVIDAVLAPNDTLARAIIEALLTDEKYANNVPVVTGQDGELASIKLIRDGVQNMTVFKDTRNLAKATIELADALLNDKTPSVPGARLDTESYDTGLKVVNAYLLEPQVLTSDNYTDIIDAGYYEASDLD